MFFVSDDTNEVLRKSCHCYQKQKQETPRNYKDCIGYTHARAHTHTYTRLHSYRTTTSTSIWPFLLNIRHTVLRGFQRRSDTGTCVAECVEHGAERDKARQCHWAYPAIAAELTVVVTRYELFSVSNSLQVQCRALGTLLVPLPVHVVCSRKWVSYGTGWYTQGRIKGWASRTDVRDASLSGVLRRHRNNRKCGTSKVGFPHECSPETSVTTNLR
jgi:hypothetical protein